MAGVYLFNIANHFKRPVQTGVGQLWQSKPRMSTPWWVIWNHGHQRERLVRTSADKEARLSSAHSRRFHSRNKISLNYSALLGAGGWCPWQGEGRGSSEAQVLVIRSGNNHASRTLSTGTLLSTKKLKSRSRDPFSWFLKLHKYMNSILWFSRLDWGVRHKGDRSAQKAALPPVAPHPTSGQLWDGLVTALSGGQHMAQGVPWCRRVQQRLWKWLLASEKLPCFQVFRNFETVSWAAGSTVG